MSQNNLIWYKEKETLGHSYLERSIQYSSVVKSKIQTLFWSTSLERRIESMRLDILNNKEHNGSIEKSSDWYNSMTSYMDILKHIEDTVAQVCCTKYIISTRN